jgi:hypothetical protein
MKTFTLKGVQTIVQGVTTTTTTTTTTNTAVVIIACPIKMYKGYSEINFLSF